jgi:hydrogenase nickel incorporation protein HypB
MTPRIVEVRQNILRKNDELARSLRARFAEAGVFVVSLVSSPGSGKTALLQRTLAEMRTTCAMAALVGDLATDCDAQRLAQTGVPVRQIITGTVSHLDAEMVERALDGWDLSALDMLFIENVGNLVCPASYDLGEHARVVLMSVTEGEDKPRKYPSIFNGADAVVLTKMDLADAVGFNRDEALASIGSVRPDIAVIESSAKTPLGLVDWFRWLDAIVNESITLSSGCSDDHRERPLPEIVGRAEHRYEEREAAKSRSK